MFSPVASCVFAFRNVNKTENGEIGRAPVAVGQFTGLIKEIAKYDKAIGMGAKNAVSIFKEIAGDTKAFRYAGNTLEFLSNNVNPLICASSALKVAMAKDEDKDRVLLEQLGMLGFMFTGENLVSKNYDKVINSKAIKPLMSKITKGAHGGKIAAIIKGLTFLTASIGCSNIGSGLVKSCLKTKDKDGRECIIS